MNPLYIGILMGLIGGITALIKKLQNDKRDASVVNQNADEAATGRLVGALQPGEAILAISTVDHKNRYYWAATNFRVLIEDKAGLHSLPYGNITKFRMYNHDMEKTKDPNSCFCVKITADKKYALYSYSGKFASVVARIQKKCG